MLMKEIIYRAISLTATIASLATTLACTQTNSNSIEYELVELSPPTACNPADINELNEVLCTSNNVNYIFRQGEYVPLQTDSELSPGWLTSFNSLGMAVGHTGNSMNSFPSFYDNGMVSIIDEFGEGASEFSDINNSGIAVGWRGTMNENFIGFVYENGQARILSGCPGYQHTQAMGINNNNEIVINCAGESTPNHLIVVMDANTDIILDDPFLSRIDGRAEGINDKRVVIGTLMGENASKPFIYYPDTGLVKKIGLGHGGSPSRGLLSE